MLTRFQFEHPPSHLFLVGFSMDAGALIVEFKDRVIVGVWLGKIEIGYFLSLD